MSPDRFRQLCETHDWPYEFSDDHTVWLRGKAEREVLQAAVRQDAALREIFDCWNSSARESPTL